MRICLAAVLVAVCGGAAQAQVEPQSAPAHEANRIYPGDVVVLKVWNEPTLSGEWTVPREGVVVFPKLGPRNVTDGTIVEVRQALLAEYATYLVNPAIQFEVQRKVQILGAVRNPGVYTLDPTLTISDALAMAGGVTYEGRLDRLELRRDGVVIRVLLLSSAPCAGARGDAWWKAEPSCPESTARTALADSPIRSGDQLFVPERSYFSRNTGAIAALISSVALIISLVTR